jgi:hypothetical protein
MGLVVEVAAAVDVLVAEGAVDVLLDEGTVVALAAVTGDTVVGVVVS